MPNILIVEDDELTIMAIQHLLTKNDYTVDVASNGREALEKINTNKYNVVVTDLMMPFINGMQLVEAIRSDPSKKNVGIVVISSIGKETSLIEAFNLGADDYLSKPINPKELLIRVNKLLMRNKFIKAD